MNKKLYILLPLLLVSSGSQAHDITTALKTCSNEQDSLKRLVCFDQVVKDINHFAVAEKSKVAAAKEMSKPVPNAALKNVTASTDAVAVSEPLPVNHKPVDQAEADFGLEHKKAAELNEDKLYAQVSSINKDPYKNLILTLNNGQVWKQTEAKYFKVKESDTIYVERGALGSFFLGMDDTNRRIRVKRIK